ncbi:MAG: hypothetical protein LBS84_03725 [Clostridiales bacterium]|jgi:hypothetical protein|nr:hypothetical protein [Clostridiales bacterium]
MKRARNKALVLSAAAVVSAAVLAATAFAAAANVSGYEELKQRGFALIDQSGNSTSTVIVEMIADGEKVFSQSVFTEKNEEQGAHHRTETFDGGEDSYWGEVYWYGTTCYSFSSINPDEYKEFSGYSKDNGRELKLTENQKRFSGIILDLLTSDLKNFFVTDGNTISVSLDKNQIPELAQSFIAVVAETSIKKHEDNPNYYIQSDGLDSVITKYFYEPVIESYFLTATISDDGYLSDSNASVSLSGKDANGESHTATLILSMTFSDIGSTTVEAFDPQGKTLRQ